MQKYKYLIFDLDGTLIESFSGILNIILEELQKIPDTDIENARYILTTSTGMALEKQVEILYPQKTKKEAIELTKYLYKKIKQKENAKFFKGVPEKIKELHKKGYSLFLTTGSSTNFAKENLEKAKILDCFELVYGSDIILKGKEHLELFKQYSNDKNFYKRSLYIGDGDMDKLFAKEAGIDFVRIGKTKTKDEKVIKSVAKIDKFLRKY